MSRNSFKPDPADSIIILMGPTGSGKSNFINTLTGNVEKDKASSVKSDTQHVVPYPIMDQGVRVVLVDTPGFNDALRLDDDILRKIVDWLKRKYPDGGTLNVAGVIYLHRITDNRMSGSVYKNLQTFGRRCGNLSLRRARLVTTMWDNVKHQQMAENREKELTGDVNFWKRSIEEGAVARRFNNTRQCAWDIVHDLTRMVGDSEHLHPQEELVRQNEHSNETVVAEALYSRFQNLQKKTFRELRRLFLRWFGSKPSPLDAIELDNLQG